jgi:hypothetical protein
MCGCIAAWLAAVTLMLAVAWRFGVVDFRNFRVARG